MRIVDTAWLVISIYDIVLPSVNHELKYEADLVVSNYSP